MQPVPATYWQRENQQGACIAAAEIRCVNEQRELTRNATRREALVEEAGVLENEFYRGEV